MILCDNLENICQLYSLSYTEHEIYRAEVEVSHAADSHPGIYCKKQKKSPKRATSNSEIKSMTYKVFKPRGNREPGILMALATF